MNVYNFIRPTATVTPILRGFHYFIKTIFQWVRLSAQLAVLLINACRGYQTLY